MSRLFALGLMLCSACTAPVELTVGEDDLELRDEAQPVFAWSEDHVPKRVAPVVEQEKEDIPASVAGAARPRLRLVHPYRRSENYEPPDDLDTGYWLSTEFCEFRVEAYSFPAVSLDGRYLVHRFPDDEWESDGSEGIEWMDDGDPEPYFEFGAVMVDLQVGEETAVQLLSSDEVPRNRRQWIDCKKTRARIKEEVRRVNAMLADHRWRAMATPEDLGISLASSPSDRDARKELPKEDRGIEFVEQQRSLILRIPGVKVLHRQRTDWRPRDPNCFDYPVLENLYVDPVSGTALVQMEAMCTCFGSEGVRTELMRFSEEAMKRLSA